MAQFIQFGCAEFFVLCQLIAKTKNFDLNSQKMGLKPDHLFRQPQPYLGVGSIKKNELVSHQSPVCPTGQPLKVLILFIAKENIADSHDTSLLYRIEPKSMALRIGVQ